VNLQQIILLFLVSAFFPGCPLLSAEERALSRPDESDINCADDILRNYDGELRDVLFRYLASNPRWEIREERGLKYAVRLEEMGGKYETTLNGFYSTYNEGAVRQTRVILAFDRPYGFGREHGNITRVAPGTKNVSVIVESNSFGTPGHSSYTIISGPAINLEIYDQAPILERKWTQTAFDDVCAELREVQFHREQIRKTGVMPIAQRYPKPLPTEAAFSVTDGFQPGIYMIDAAINPREPGYTYLKAYESKSGKRLSETRITGRSTRYVGWSEDSMTLFRYGSEVTVYEGDWSHTYEARFELWHHAVDGTETKLAEMKRMVNGWEQ
jgi:hypothetical protein